MRQCQQTHANSSMSVKIARHYSNQNKVIVVYFAHTGRWNALLCSCHKNAVRRTDLPGLLCHVTHVLLGVLILSDPYGVDLMGAGIVATIFDPLGSSKTAKTIPAGLNICRTLFTTLSGRPHRGRTFSIQGATVRFIKHGVEVGLVLRQFYSTTQLWLKIPWK